VVATGIEEEEEEEEEKEEEEDTSTICLQGRLEDARS
jgi:hypothetical protein